MFTAGAIHFFNFDKVPVFNFERHHVTTCRTNHHLRLCRLCTLQNIRNLHQSSTDNFYNPSTSPSCNHAMYVWQEPSMASSHHLRSGHVLQGQSPHKQNSSISPHKGQVIEPPPCMKRYGVCVCRIPN